MMKRIFPWLVGMIGCLIFSVFASGNVTVYFPEGGHMVLADVQNLSQLLNQPKVNEPQTIRVLAEKRATVVAQKQYQQVIQRLTFWEEKGERTYSINAVLRQLMEVRVIGRQFVNLDLDWINLRPEANFPLGGDYSLYLRKRDMTVRLMGAISDTGKQNWKPQYTVSEYLKGHYRLAGADPDQVVIIGPNGNIRYAPTAYWNEYHIEVEPGSIIWVGFSSDVLPVTDPELGRDIISVLRRRIPD